MKQVFYLMKLEKSGSLYWSKYMLQKERRMEEEE